MSGQRITIEDFIKSLGPLKKFKPHMLLNEEGNCADILLEDVPYYLEWIPGEGGDIGLYRAMDDKRIVGACLPFYPGRTHEKQR